VVAEGQMHAAETVSVPGSFCSATSIRLLAVAVDVPTRQWQQYRDNDQNNEWVDHSCPSRLNARALEEAFSRYNDSSVCIINML
jgi:hypothetical protein